MMNKTSLIGLMLVLGALPVAMVGALPSDDGCTDSLGAAKLDNMHYYTSGSGFGLYVQESSGDTLLSLGSGTVFDSCVPDVANGEPADAWDTDYETGSGAVRFQAGVSNNEFELDPVTLTWIDTGAPCSPTAAHHSLNFYVRDFVIDETASQTDRVHGSAGADGTTTDDNCGDGIVDGNDADDCLESFEGQGPHTACGISKDGTYWVWIDNVAADADTPVDYTTTPPTPGTPGSGQDVNGATTGCAWTDNFAGANQNC